jgi:hypothetical protein
MMRSIRIGLEAVAQFVTWLVLPRVSLASFGGFLEGALFHLQLRRGGTVDIPPGDYQLQRGLVLGGAVPLRLRATGAMPWFHVGRDALAAVTITHGARRAMVGLGFRGAS